MPELSWVKWEPRAWLSSPEIRMLSAEDRGHLMDILCTMYCCEGGGGFIASPKGKRLTTEQVCTALHVPASAIRSILASDALCEVDGSLHCPKAEAVLARAMSATRTRQAAGRKGAAGRWGGKNEV